MASFLPFPITGDKAKDAQVTERVVAVIRENQTPAQRGNPIGFVAVVRDDGTGTGYACTGSRSLVMSEKADEISGLFRAAEGKARLVYGEIAAAGGRSRKQLSLDGVGLAPAAPEPARGKGK